MFSPNIIRGTLPYIEENKGINRKIFICPYQINSFAKLPFLQYILWKKDGTFHFPSFEFITLCPADMDDVMEMCDQILNAIQAIYKDRLGNDVFTCDQEIRFKYQGYIVFPGGDCFLFFDCSAFAIDVHKLNIVNDIWFVLIDEIINHQSCCNFPISKRVIDFISSDPTFYTIARVETPVVGYVGCHVLKLEFIATFGQSPCSLTGLHEFTTYEQAIRMAGWKPQYIKKTKDGVIDECGRYNRGGIVRFALFLGEMVVGATTSKSKDSIFVSESHALDYLPAYLLKHYESQCVLTFHCTKITDETWVCGKKYYIE